MSARLNWIARFAPVIILLSLFVFTITSEAGAHPIAAPGGPLGGGPVPGGPGYESITGLDFRPYTPTAVYNYSGVCLVNSSGGLGVYEAKVRLPHGVTINKMVVYYSDSNATVNQDLTVRLTNAPLGGVTGIVLGSFQSTGAPGSAVFGEVTSFTNPLVDLSIGSYFLEVVLPTSGTVTLCGVRVDYGYSTALPVIMK